MRDRFPSLFEVATVPEGSVAEMWSDTGWHLEFRRELDVNDRIMRTNLLREIESSRLGEEPDRIIWALEPSGIFSVKSLYRKLYQGIPQKHFSEIWKIAIPLKVRIFLWQLARKRLPANENIRKRKGPSTGRCALCGEVEDSDHIFFSCTLARFMWSAVRELLSCSWNPSSFADVYRILQSHIGQTRRVFSICCVALCWTL